MVLHPFAAVTVKVITPGPKPLTVGKVPPLLQAYDTGIEVLVPNAVIIPVNAPEQLMLL